MSSLMLSFSVVKCGSLVFCPACVVICILSGSSVFLFVPWIDVWSVMNIFSVHIYFVCLSFYSCEDTILVKLQFSTSSMVPS